MKITNNNHRLNPAYLNQIIILHKTDNKAKFQKCDVEEVEKKHLQNHNGLTSFAACQARQVIIIMDSNKNIFCGIYL